MPPRLHALCLDDLGGLVRRLDLQGDVVQARAGRPGEEAVEVRVIAARREDLPTEVAGARDLHIDPVVTLVVLELAAEAEAEEPFHDRDLRVQFGYSHADVVVPLDLDHVSSDPVRGFRR